MPASLLGLMLLACPQYCELPLPGSVLELHRQPTRWSWCVRAKPGAQWRLCDRDLPDDLPASLEAALRRLRADAAPGTTTGGEPMHRA